MLSEIYWIEAGVTPKLAIMARPRAGDWLGDEVVHWKTGIEYLSFPIRDRGVPSDVIEASRFASGVAGLGKVTAIHCRASIGRAAIIAAAVLVSRGLGAEAALSEISVARRTQVPDTNAQREWVLSLDRR
jgi:protein-tyrosine phosphatase